jgi:hypothetical protein
MSDNTKAERLSDVPKVMKVPASLAKWQPVQLCFIKGYSVCIFNANHGDLS